MLVQNFLVAVMMKLKHTHTKPIWPYINSLWNILLTIISSSVSLLDGNTKCFMLIQCVINFTFINLATCSSRIKPDAAKILFKVQSKKLLQMKNISGDSGVYKVVIG